MRFGKTQAPKGVNAAVEPFANRASGDIDAGRSLHRVNRWIFRAIDRVCPFLRSHQVNPMHIESVVMLAICGLMMLYLVYALLRPEKF
jgi:K+-transporting ATPase KdpF subunit